MNNNIIEYSEDLEAFILNQLIYFNNYLLDLLPKINKDYFYNTENKQLFDFLCLLFYENKPTTPEFFLEFVKMKNDTLYNKAFDILFELNNTKSLDLLSEQINQLEVYYFKRLVKSKTLDSLQRIKEYTTTEQIIRDVQYTSNEIVNKSCSKDNNQIENLIDLYEKEDCIVKTNFGIIDNFTAITRNNLIIIGARPSIGKSAFALNLAVNMAKEMHVLFISMEMSQKEIVDRIFSIVANEIKYNILSNKTVLDFTKDKVRNLKMTIIDKSMTIDEIQQQIMKNTSNLGAVFVDYLQLINASKITNNRYQDVSEISRRLKLMTMDFNIPIFALSQLNRAVELRNDKKPILADLRESGSIEQDANQVWLLHREGFYNPEANQKTMEVIVAKNRSGATGSIELGFAPQKYKLYDYV